jgi:hypothetical protein
MIRSNRMAFIRALALSTFAAGSLSAALLAEAMPPPGATPPDVPNPPHRDPVWQACQKKLADKNILAPDERIEFFNNCLKSAKAPAPAPSREAMEPS